MCLLAALFQRSNSWPDTDSLEITTCLTLCLQEGRVHKWKGSHHVREILRKKAAVNENPAKGLVDVLDCKAKSHLKWVVVKLGVEDKWDFNMT